MWDYSDLRLGDMEDPKTMMKHGALVGGALFLVMLGMGQDSGTAANLGIATGAAVSAYMITFGHELPF